MNIPGTIAPAMLETQVRARGPDASDLFAGTHQDANTVRTLQSAQGCHIGTIAQAPAGTQQGQPAHVASPGRPGHQGQSGRGQSGQGQNAQGQNAQGQNAQGQNGQPDADDEDDGGTAAERRRREEARNRRLRKTYNPLRQDPDDADEYPADAVAMGYLPDLEGRRWREKRMRLSRFIQFNDIPAIDEEDLDPVTAQWLDLDFVKEIRYQRNLKGGEARGCTGSFRVARPPPPRSQLRPRDPNRRPGGQGQPPPRDPPDSDASSDDDDDDAPGVPAVRARQIQLEGRVRQWFPSNSNRTGPGPTHLATPPVTPHNRPPQQTLEPPAPPPQDPQQLTPEQEQEIIQRRQREERAAADKAIRDQQLNATAVKERMDKLYPPKQKDKVQAPGKGTQDKIQKPQVKKPSQPSKPSEGQKKQQEEQRKQQEARKAQAEQKRQQEEREAQEKQKKQTEAENEQKRLKEQNAAKKKADDQKRQSIEGKVQGLRKDGDKIVKEATNHTEEQRGNQEAPKKLDDRRDKSLQTTHDASEQQKREKELAEAKRLRAEYVAFVKQEERIDNIVREGVHDEEKAKRIVAADRGGVLLKNPYKESQGTKGTSTPPQNTKKAEATPTTTPEGGRKKEKATPYIPATKDSKSKRPVETTKEDQTPVKKPRTDKTPEAQKDQTGGKSGGGGGGGKFTDKNRPSWSTQKKKEPRKKDVQFGDLSDEDSPDELAPVSSKAGTKGSAKGGPANPPPPAGPPLPADLPTRPAATLPSGTYSSQNILRLREKLISSPAGGNTSNNTAVTPANTTVGTTATASRPKRKARVSSKSVYPPGFKGTPEGAKASQSAKPSPRPSAIRRRSGDW